MNDWLGRNHLHGVRDPSSAALAAARFVLAAPLLMIAGCGGGTDSSTTPGPGETSNVEAAGQWQEELYSYAVSNLNRLEDFDTGEMIQQILSRLDPRVPPQGPTPNRKGDGLMQSWPEPEMLRQIINRLNQWIQSQSPPPDWKVDPLLATLRGPLQRLPQVENLDKLEFSGYDGFALREVVWLRDVSTWTRGDKLGKIDRAKKLFDWTVRNIQLEADSADWIPQFPWETLLFGRGTATERAWVFILLARQQGLDAALLAIAKRDDSGAEVLRPWTVGVLSEGKLYLFDPALGLAVPAPDGVKLDDAGQLEIQPATLAQVVADDALLRQLDVGRRDPYFVESSDLKRVVALVEASPTYLASRMKLVESHLAGEQKMVLTTSPTLLAESLSASPHVAEVRLWTLPFETIRRRSQLDRERVEQRLKALLPFYMLTSAPLLRGRTLHLKGELTGSPGATKYYQQARPSNRDLKVGKQELAARHYENLRETDRRLSQEQIKWIAEELARSETTIVLRAKQDASYWLGLIAFERANYPSAIHYFTRGTLEAWPGGPWNHGAKYNLARTYETSGQQEKAVLLYLSNTTSPGYHGNSLRARWLETQRQGGQPAQPETGRQESNVDVPEPEVEVPEPDAQPPDPDDES